jgi:hypothetical protein
MSDDVQLALLKYGTGTTLGVLFLWLLLPKLLEIATHQFKSNIDLRNHKKKSALDREAELEVIRRTFHQKELKLLLEMWKLAGVLIPFEEEFVIKNQKIRLGYSRSEYEPFLDRLAYAGLVEFTNCRKNHEVWSEMNQGEKFTSFYLLTPEGVGLAKSLIGHGFIQE